MSDDRPQGPDDPTAEADAATEPTPDDDDRPARRRPAGGAAAAMAAARGASGRSESEAEPDSEDPRSESAADEVEDLEGAGAGDDPAATEEAVAQDDPAGTAAADEHLTDESDLPDSDPTDPEPGEAESADGDPIDDEPIDDAPNDDAPTDDEAGHALPAEETPGGPVGPVGPASASESEEPGSHRRRWILLGAAAVVAALYVAGYFLTGTTLPADASIGGVDVGGESPAAAEQTLEDELAPRADQPVVLEHEDQTFEIAGEDAGLTLDPQASVDQAGGERSWDPRDMVALLWGSHEHDLVFDVDADAMDSALASITEAVAVPVTEAVITFPDAEPEPQSPEDGLVVRRVDTAELITSRYLVTDEPAEVPTEVAEPVVDEEGLQRAMTEIAEPAVSGPVIVRVGDDEVDLPVTAYAPALRVEPVDGAMTPVIDPEKLAEPLTDATTGIGEKAVDATVDIENGEPVVVPGKEGVGLQPQEMAEKLVPVLTETGEARSVEIEADVVEPEFTTEDAEALNITEKISEFTTYYPHAPYRNTNQGRAAQILDGTLLKPGDLFSFNDTVGERTAANGFTTGSVINRGRFVDELGGGVSQVVTTTYNASFFAGLEDVEHHPHAFYIDRYPVGREATVYFGSLDLRFRNSLQNGVLIKAFVNPSTPGNRGAMTVQMWGTKEFDVKAGASARRNFREPKTKYDPSPDCQGQSPLRGFDIDIYRTLSKGGQVVKRETDTAVYQAADRIICGEDPDDD